MQDTSGIPFRLVIARHWLAVCNALHSTVMQDMTYHGNASRSCKTWSATRDALCMQQAYKMRQTVLTFRPPKIRESASAASLLFKSENTRIVGARHAFSQNKIVVCTAYKTASLVCTKNHSRIFWHTVYTLSIRSSFAQRAPTAK